MEYPKIGDTITTARAIELCTALGLKYLVERIRENPDQYDSWRFDGCSMLPDSLLGLFTGCDRKDITYKCCLPHDLCYAYGEPDNGIEKHLVDAKFKSNLITKAKMTDWCAQAFYAAVSFGGAAVFGLPFSWGFASKKQEETWASNG